MENKPPRKWEPWVAAALIFIWIANTGSNASPDTEGVAIAFLVGGIIWFVTIFSRYSSFKKAQAVRAKETSKEGRS